MSVEKQAPARTRLVIVLLPLIVFLALATIFFRQLVSGADVSVVPSALIGQQAPLTNLPPLEGMDLPGLDTAAFGGNVTLVNVFASWCAPCREEHPMLLQLSQDKRFQVVGLNYKDQPANARRFLGELGNPFAAIGVDEKGRAAIDWGVYGVPETFVIGKDGTILFKHVGPIDPDGLRDRLMPEIEKALTG